MTNEQREFLCLFNHIRQNRKGFTRILNRDYVNVKICNFFISSNIFRIDVRQNIALSILLQCRGILSRDELTCFGSVLVALNFSCYLRAIVQNADTYSILSLFQINYYSQSSWHSVGTKKRMKMVIIANIFGKKSDKL